MQPEQREQLLNLYLSVQHIAKVFNSFKPNQRPKVGEDILTGNQPTQNVIAIVKENGLLENYKEFEFLAKLLIQCCNDPKKLEISEIDLNTDFDLNLIEDYFNKIEK